jgi:hypothetical protein
MIPSIEMIPGKYGVGTLLCPMPLDGSGDFNVSRSASNAATRVNAQGFIETVPDNVPRLDYLQPDGSIGCPALLVEPSAQNIMIQSQNILLGLPSQAGTTVNSDVIISPDGTQNADLVLFSGSSYRLRSGITIAASTNYASSIFIKNDDFLSSDLLTFNVSDGVVGSMTATINVAAKTATYSGTAGAWTNVSGTIQEYNNGWFRVMVRGTSVNGGGGWYEIATGASKSCYVWGLQLETGSVPTSYIPTTTAAITRGAEVVSKTGLSSLIGQTEGTIYVEVVLSRINANYIISLGTLDDRIMINFDSSTSVLALIRVGGATANYTATIPAIPATGGVYKIALAYKANDYCFAVNGVAYPSTASRGVPANMSSVYLGASVFSTAQLNDRIRADALYPTRLSNTDLALLTA